MKQIKRYMLVIIGIIVACMLSVSCATTTHYGLKHIDLDSNVILVYTSEWCRVCDAAKDFLENNDVEYIELDYENPAELKRLNKLAVDLGYVGVFDSVPVFVIRKNILVGYDPEFLSMIINEGH